MMSSPEIEEFAQLLVQRVRDAAVSQSDILLRPDREASLARRRRTGSPPDALELAIPDIVDSVMFHLLHAIDAGGLHLTFVASTGREVDLAAEGKGELAGCYTGTDGWLSRYARERHADDGAARP